MFVSEKLNLDLHEAWLTVTTELLNRDRHRPPEHLLEAHVPQHLLLL